MLAEDHSPITPAMDSARHARSSADHKPPFRVIHIVHGKANPAGHNGISRVVYHLNREEKRHGVQSEIWALVDGVKKHYSHQRDDAVSVECFPRVRFPFGSHEIIERLLAEKNSIALVHFHLIWNLDKNLIALALKKAGVRFIITSHGTYSKPHAYTGKRWIARLLYERDFLNLATEIHAITREEGTGLQAYGYRGRSFVAFNGVALDEVPARRRTDYFSDKPYANKAKFIWVGVLREDKNLRALIEAVSLLPAQLKDQFVCVLVGPDYRGNAGTYLSLARDLCCPENFDYIGPLYDQNKYDAIESTDAFVLPSFSEVFSLAVLDAMACSKPCLVSSGCGYDYFTKEDFFVRCEPYAQDIARGIAELLALRERWAEMGKRARNLIDRELNWAAIAKVMIQNYIRISEA